VLGHQKTCGGVDDGGMWGGGGEGGGRREQGDELTLGVVDVLRPSERDGCL
jgi:hypothetical protein